MIGSICVGLFIYLVQPFESVTQNRIEVYNEISLYLICVSYIAFTDINANSYSKQLFGWVGMAAIMQNFIINIGILLAGNAMSLIQFIRKNYSIKKHSAKYSVDFL